MSGLFAVAETPAIALSANVAKTVLQLAGPPNHRVKILGWGVYFDGTSSTAVPVAARVLRQSTAGTMTGLTPTKTIPAAETILTAAQHTASAEPTAGDQVDMALVPPTTGYEVKFPFGQEIYMEGGGRLGIEITAPAIVNVKAKFFFEE
jgi:hypothetical protein